MSSTSPAEGGLSVRTLRAHSMFWSSQVECMKLLSALGVCLLVASPALAQSADWRTYRDKLLGVNRSDLMTFCGLGRKANAQAMSYFADIANASDERLSAQGYAPDVVQAMSAGRASAMAVACPSVW